MATWKDLNMKNKAELISLFVNNGITDIDEMTSLYNTYSNGGHLFADGTPELDIYGGGTLQPLAVSATLTRDQWNNLYKKGKVQLSDIPRKYQSWIQGENGSVAKAVIEGREKAAEKMLPVMLGLATGGAGGAVGTLLGTAIDMGVNASSKGQKDSFGDIFFDEQEHPVGNYVMDMMNPGYWVGAGEASKVLRFNPSKDATRASVQLRNFGDQKFAHKFLEKEFANNVGKFSPYLFSEFKQAPALIKNTFDETGFNRVVGRDAIQDALNSGIIQAKTGWHHGSLPKINEVMGKELLKHGITINDLSKMKPFDARDYVEKVLGRDLSFTEKFNFKNSTNHGNTVGFNKNSLFYGLNPNEHIIKGSYNMSDQFLPGHHGNVHIDLVPQMNTPNGPSMTTVLKNFEGGNKFAKRPTNNFTYFTPIDINGTERFVERSFSPFEAPIDLRLKNQVFDYQVPNKGTLPYRISTLTSAEKAGLPKSVRNQPVKNNEAFRTKLINEYNNWIRQFEEPYFRRIESAAEHNNYIKNGGIGHLEEMPVDVRYSKIPENASIEEAMDVIQKTLKRHNRFYRGVELPSTEADKLLVKGMSEEEQLIHAATTPRGDGNVLWITPSSNSSFYGKTAIIERPYTLGKNPLNWIKEGDFKIKDSKALENIVNGEIGKIEPNVVYDPWNTVGYGSNNIYPNELVSLTPFRFLKWAPEGDLSQMSLNYKIHKNGGLLTKSNYGHKYVDGDDLNISTEQQGLSNTYGTRTYHFNPSDIADFLQNNQHLLAALDQVTYKNSIC